MFHAAAYFSAALPDTTTNFDVPALTDNVLTIANTHFLPQIDLDLVAAYTASTTMNRTRIVSPTNRQITLPFIRPINVGENPITQQMIADYRDNPFRVRGLEELAVESSSDLACGVEDTTTILFLTPGLRPAPRGNIFTMRVTSTTASVADTWTTVAAVFPDILPQGEFAVLGLEYIAATATAARLILNEQTWRPGCIAQVLVGSQGDKMFRKGGLGDWGHFKSTAMPEFQVLNSAAVSVHTFFLDLVRLS